MGRPKLTKGWATLETDGGKVQHFFADGKSLCGVKSNAPTEGWAFAKSTSEGSISLPLLIDERGKRFTGQAAVERATELAHALTRTSAWPRIPPAS